MSESGGPERDEVLTAEEAAELLRVSLQTLFKESRSGRLPGVKVGREWRYSKLALLRHLGQYVGDPTDEDVAVSPSDGPGAG